MTATPPRSTAPLWGAVGAGLLAAVLAVVYVVVLNRDDSAGASPQKSSGTAVGALTGRERTAVKAAEIEALNLQTFTRATFDKDWARAVAGATGNLKRDLGTSRKAQTKSVLDKNKIDLRADVVDSALVGPTDKPAGYVVIVVMNGYRVAGEKQSTPLTQRLQLTMVQQGGKWLASDVTQRGLS